MVAVENLSFVYHPGTPLERKALDHVSLRIAPGECLGIIGATGSGKTTWCSFQRNSEALIRKVYVEGRTSIPGSFVERVAPKSGTVFQYPEHQIFEETVFAEISFVLRQQKVHPAEEIALGEVSLRRGRPGL